MALQIIKGIELTHKETQSKIVFRLDKNSWFNIRLLRNNGNVDGMNDWLKDYTENSIHLLIDEDTNTLYKLDFQTVENH
jgi:hypothetical protein